MPSLRELQQQFADALFAGDEAPPPFAFNCGDPAMGAERMAIYRRTVRTNYRNALDATFPVVWRLVGTPCFHAAVDAFARAHPSRSGDLNEYGDEFGDFLAGYPPAASLPYLADVAHLEWAIDEANRAPDSTVAPDIVLGALAVLPADQLPASRLRIEPSCRLVASEFPLLRIWQVNQPAHDGDLRVALDGGPCHLRIRREPDGIAVECIAAGEFGWLAALSRQATLAAAIERAQGLDATFDLGAALHRFIGDGTIHGVGENR
jgi:hypothetical protein